MNQINVRKNLRAVGGSVKDSQKDPEKHFYSLNFYDPSNGDTVSFSCSKSSYENVVTWLHDNQLKELDVICFINFQFFYDSVKQVGGFKAFLNNLTLA